MNADIMKVTVNGMIKAVLLGDSIRQIGYGKKVAENLTGEIEVWQPEENGRFAMNTLRSLFDDQKELRSADIVHWNVGLWDTVDLFGDGLFTALDDYIRTVLRIAGVLKSYGVRKIIFASTTPVRAENRYNRSVDIENYNRAVLPLLAARGVLINDLFSLVAADVARYIRSDDCVHLTEEGIALCADAVTACIRGAAKTL